MVALGVDGVNFAALRLLTPMGLRFSFTINENRSRVR